MPSPGRRLSKAGASACVFFSRHRHIHKVAKFSCSPAVVTFFSIAFFFRFVSVMASSHRQSKDDDLTATSSGGSEEDLELFRGLEESSDVVDVDDTVFVGRDDLYDFNKDNILPQPPEVLSKIRRWLQATTYDEEGSEYRKHLASHLDGTGSWLFSSEIYRNWHSSEDHGLLWIRGTFIFFSSCS